MLFNHCKHQRWRIWWRENWLLLGVFDQTGLWCLLFPPSSPWALLWHYHVASGSGICTWSAFPCLHLHPLRDTAPGVMPSPVKRGRVPHSCPTMSSDRPCCHSVSQGLPSKPGNSHLAFSRPLTHEFLSAVLENLWSQETWEWLVGIPERCASTLQQRGRSKPPVNETPGVQQEAFCHRMELSAGCKAFLGSSTNTPSIWSSLHCQLCLQADKLRSDWKKKSCRWRSWSCLKKYNTQERDGGRKEPAFVKSDHVNSVASVLSYLLCSPALQSVSHTEVYF